MPLRLKFAHKILLHSLVLILITGVGITTVIAYQFRARLYAREFGSAFTAYLAGLNYLTAHYRSKGDRFVRSSLDYVLQQKFLRLEGSEYPRVLHQPLAVFIYDETGYLIYEYTSDGRMTAPAQLPAEARPERFEQRYERHTQQIRMAGPISEDGTIPGFVVMYFPSGIQAEVYALYRQSFTVMAWICLAAVLISVIFARRVLKPIEDLTRAARKVHEGDLDQQVPVSTGDEIGMLGETFNQMLSSLVRRIALMHRLQEWTVRISKLLDPDQLVEDLAEMFERMTQSSFVRLYTVTAPGGALELRRERGVSAGRERTGMALRAHETGQTQYRDATGEVRQEASRATELAVPLAIGSKRLGAIHLGPRLDGAPYADETMTTVETLAQHAAMALENAQLYQAVAERERVRQEMQWAREIQQTLLPRIMPEIPGYLIHGVSVPALEVGGDYFDVVPTGPAWSCIIGDVSGKGVPAAMIMSIVRSLIHTYAEVASDPLDIFRLVNRKLTPDLESEMFVTLAAFTFDPLTHNATVVRAGHEPLYLVRAGGAVDRLQPAGTAMGLTDVPVFEELLTPVAVSFQPGDTLVMFTDGITETQNRDRVELGYDRFQAWVQRHAHRTAPDLVAALVQEVQAFAAGAPTMDDLTLLVIQRV